MKSVPLPRIGMRVVKTAVAVMLSYTIFVPFGLIYNEALGACGASSAPSMPASPASSAPSPPWARPSSRASPASSAWRWAEPWATATLLLGAALDDPWVRIPPPWGRCAWRGVDLPAAQAAHRLRHGVHPALRHPYHRRHRRDPVLLCRRPHH